MDKRDLVGTHGDDVGLRDGHFRGDCRLYAGLNDLICFAPGHGHSGRQSAGSLCSPYTAGGESWSWLWGVPGPAMRPVLWGSQILGHPGATGSLRRAEERIVGGGVEEGGRQGGGSEPRG